MLLIKIFMTLRKNILTSGSIKTKIYIYIQMNN